MTSSAVPRALVNFFTVFAVFAAFAVAAVFAFFAFLDLTGSPSFVHSFGHCPVRNFTPHSDKFKSHVVTQSCHAKQLIQILSKVRQAHKGTRTPNQLHSSLLRF
jgi:hypothetical protein